MAIIKLPDIGSLSMLSEHIAHSDIVDNVFLTVELEGCLNAQKDIVDKELYIETFSKYSNNYFDHWLSVWGSKGFPWYRVLGIK